MLNKHQMQEIQNLKILGYTKTDIQDYYRKLGGKVPSRPGFTGFGGGFLLFSWARA